MAIRAMSPAGRASSGPPPGPICSPTSIRTGSTRSATGRRSRPSSSATRSRWLRSSPGSPAGPVEVAFTDGWIRLDDVEIRLLEEPDVGDLYTFCPVDGSIAAPPHDLRVENGAVVAGWDGCRVRLVPRRMDGEPFVRV